jgi:hypothetical protein
MPGRTIIPQQPAKPIGLANWRKWLDSLCFAACCLAALLLVALPGSLLAHLAVFRLVECPLHMVDAPVEGLLADLLLFWFIVFWRSFLPFLIFSVLVLAC